MNDKQLRQDILDVFQWEPRIEPSHIKVTVERGVVTLTGDVESDDEKIAAEQAVRHVDGVRDIAEKIEVHALHPLATPSDGANLTFDTD